MNRGVRLASFIALLGGVALIPACGGGGGKPKVAIVTNCKAEFWSICNAGAGKAAAEEGVQLDFRQPNAMDVAVQKEVIDAVTKTGVTGVAVSVINPDEQTEYLKRLSAKTNLLTMDNDALDSDRKFYVGIDNYEAGKALGRMIQDKMPGGGTVVLFIGGVTSANAKSRVGGVLDQLAGEKGAKGPQFGKFTLHNGQPYTDAGDEAKAQLNAKAVIEGLKDKENVALVGLYAYNPKQILIAYRGKKSEVKHPMKLFGFDEDYLTLDGVEAGEIEGTVVQNPFLYGYNSVKILAALGRGESVAGDAAKNLCVIPYRLVTKDGGKTETVNGIEVQNLKATDFRAELKANLASAP